MKLKKVLCLLVVVLWFGVNFSWADGVPAGEKALEIANGYYVSGCQKLESGDFEGAMRDFDKSIVSQPTPQAYLNRGYIKDEMKDFEGAISDYTLAIRNAQENELMQAECYYDRALSYESINQLKAALNDYNSAIELNSKNPDYYAQRAILKSKLNGFQNSALADIEKAIQLEPTFEPFKQIADEIKKIGTPANNNVDEPQKQATVILQKNMPEKNFVMSADECIQNKNYEKAISYLSQIIEQNPFDTNNADVYYKRGLCKKNLGKIKEAQKDYSQAVLLNSEIKKLKNYMIY